MLLPLAYSATIKMTSAYTAMIVGLNCQQVTCTDDHHTTILRWYVLMLYLTRLIHDVSTVCQRYLKNLPGDGFQGHECTRSLPFRRRVNLLPSLVNSRLCAFSYRTRRLALLTRLTTLFSGDNVLAHVSLREAAQKQARINI